MKYNVIIVGAGLAGSTAARLLAEQGMSILLIEQHKHIAGHCYDYKNRHGITVHLYGPHIFHTNSNRVWEFVNNFTDFIPYQHRVLSFVNGMYLPFPINRDTINRVFGIELSREQLPDFLQKKVKKARFNFPPQNFRDQVVSQIGEKLYELFFKNYTLKQWQRYPEELSPEIAKRIPIRFNCDDRYFSDIYQGIPCSGYAAMVKEMLTHKNISINFGQDYFRIKKDLETDFTIFTGELDRYFNYTFGRLQYRSLDLNFKTFNKEYYQQAAVINYPNDHNWTRITEFKHLTGEKSKKTTVCFEYPKISGEPYYVVMTEDNIKKQKLYLEKVKELEDNNHCYFVGRLAEYKYYNMDQVIEAAMDKIEKIFKS